VEAPASEIRKSLVAQLSPKRQATDQASRVGSGVAAPQLVYKLEPGYSVEARAVKVQGTVVLSVVIGTDGKAYDVQLRKGVGYGLDEQALTPSHSGPLNLACATAWRCRAGVDRGEFPVAVGAGMPGPYFGYTRKSSK